MTTAPSKPESRKRPGKSGNLRTEQKAQTRALILQCALEVFAERGFDGASVRDIAGFAGVNHGLIRYHFTDKDGLWKAAVEFLFDRLHEEMAAPEEDTKLPPLEQTKAWIRRYVRYCARHPEHARIMVQESIRDSERLRWAVKRFIKPDNEETRRRFRRLVEAGVYPDIPEHSFNYIITAAAQSMFMLANEMKYIYGIDVADDDVVDAHAEAIITLLFDHRAKRAAARRSRS